jgi:hypothetical protein
MHPGVKPKKDQPMAEPASTPQQMFPVVLNKHYVPRGDYQILGYQQPEVTRKDAAGKMIVVEPAKFIEGEMTPPVHPGTGFPNKIWAGTHIKLPIDEAKALVARKVADRADAIAA